MGFAYYPRVGIPSIISAAGTGVHAFHPVEQDANRRAFLYFNERVPGFQDDVDRSSRIPNDPVTNRGWDFLRNPLDVNGSGSRFQYVDYSNSQQLATLDRLAVQAKWYDYASWGLLSIGGLLWMGLINAHSYR